ncbi:flagellar hook-basal body complex protein FliE [Burkholderia sp. WAC0059]|uniref:flagellar hook-basal body complex protein FliE n=1 Tax=Burkholderia sp. WAC0059 TaxID=2066022 RepID=UPI000C7F54BD|nr:flagellar hook-basal body complex protein FliE [Burkholderia sp. WAC0059]PLZ00681.1 flagellar hook-basal body complex protein FliE [Burkholderia sp. WAC0059]
MTLPVNPLASALSQIQSMTAEAADSTPSVAGGNGAATAGSFASALKASLDKISDDQKSATSEAQAFELGSPNVSLNDVMVDSQKANLGFEFGLQVRNRLVSAYTDLMQISV